MKKIHNDRGETLVEVLASIVIGSLSIALMFGCIMVSANMDKDAKALDIKHYAGLTAADARLETEDDDSDAAVYKPTFGNVTISREDLTEDLSMDLSIKIYGGEGMASYSRADSTGEVEDTDGENEDPNSGD